MREVIYKNLTSLNSRKKDICLHEIFEKDGLTAHTERRSFYFIKEIRRFNEAAELKRWLAEKDVSADMGKRHFYIRKHHTDAPSVDKMICKVLGNIYAVVGNAVYTVVFLQSFKVLLTRTCVPE